MIALDTNILVRLLVRDDPRQVAAVGRLLREAAEAGEPCLVPDPVLCELEWVLESCYEASRSDILAAVQRLAAKSLFEFEDRAALRRALDAYQSGKGDFSDYLVGARAQSHGARTTYTFDRALRGREEFTMLSGG